VIKVITNDYVATWAWIGLVLSAGVAVGAWMRMQAAGESLSDLKSAAAAAASSARTTAPAAPADASPAHVPSAPANEGERDEPGVGAPDATG
jgi:HAMP domain-containing protein